MIIEKIKRKINSCIIKFFDYSICLFPQKRIKKDILLIKLDAIGDFILWQDSLRAYKELYKNNHITLICNSSVKEIAKQDPFFNEIVAINRNLFLFDFAYHKNIVKKIRKYKFEKIISPVFSRDAFFCEKVIALLNGKEIIGYNGGATNLNTRQRKKFDKYYTKLLNTPPKEYTSELKINGYFVSQLFNINFIEELPQLYIKDISSSKIPQEDFIAIAISASYSARAWDIEKFSNIANYLTDKYNIVLLGQGKEDNIKAMYLLKRCKDRNKIINLVNNTTILEYIEIIKRALFIIGNDSSAVHIASAVKTPSICIAPGAHYNRFVPYPINLTTTYTPRVIVHKMECFGCDYKCKYPIVKELKCIADIKEDIVIENINQLINELNNPQYEK